MRLLTGATFATTIGNLKRQFIFAPVLIHPVPTHINCRRGCFGCVALCCLGVSGRRVKALFSHRLSLAEPKYSHRAKEVVAVKLALEE